MVEYVNESGIRLGATTGFDSNNYFTMKWFKFVQSLDRNESLVSIPAPGNTPAPFHQWPDRWFVVNDQARWFKASDGSNMAGQNPLSKLFYTRVLAFYLCWMPIHGNPDRVDFQNKIRFSQ